VEKNFNTPPKLNLAQQVYAFTLPQILMDKIFSFENDTNRIIFILTYGYFKVTNKFYEIATFSKEDIKYLEQNHTLMQENLLSISNIRIRQYEKLVKDYFGIIKYSSQIQNNLQEQATHMANCFIHRKKIF